MRIWNKEEDLPLWRVVERACSLGEFRASAGWVFTTIIGGYTQKGNSALDRIPGSPHRLLTNRLFSGDMPRLEGSASSTGRHGSPSAL